MSELEVLLRKIKDKLDENEISKKDVKNFGELYSLDIEDMRKLLSISWETPAVLETLINVLVNKKEDEAEKVALNAIDYVANNTVQKYDNEKISSSMNVIKDIELFNKDYNSLTWVVEAILKSKAKTAPKAIEKSTISILLDLNEDDLTREHRRCLNIRLYEIALFISRMEDDYKVEAAEKIISNYPREKTGVLCGIIAIMSGTNEKNKIDTIVDICKNKHILAKELELMFSNYAVCATEEGLENIYEIMSYAENVIRDDLLNDLQEISIMEEYQNRINPSKTRKL